MCTGLSARGLASDINPSDYQKGPTLPRSAQREGVQKPGEEIPTSCAGTQDVSVVDAGRGRPQAISKPPPRSHPRQLPVTSCRGAARASALLVNGV